MESFDYKPKLNADNDRPSPNKGMKFFGCQWPFRQHGESGLWVSDLYPHVARQADELCVLNGMHTDSPEHAAALEQYHTGSFLFARPSLGSWVVYGLGTQNQNLPAFVTIKPPMLLGGARYFSSAFLPSTYQGMPVGSPLENLSRMKVPNLANSRYSRAEQRAILDFAQGQNRELASRTADPDPIEGVIESYELAFRMQTDLGDVLDVQREPVATLDRYGIGSGKPTDDFGRQCLMARRLAESGVRFIELCSDGWDHHGFVARLMPQSSTQVDRPIAALLMDLRERGMLDDTLLVWGGEFGRTPDDPRGDGRGHNPHGFTVWLAGGGVRGGLAHGKTDDYGYKAVEGRVHLHDLHATLLHLLGLDHTRLTYRYAGRDFRLTDVHGKVVQEILA